MTRPVSRSASRRRQTVGLMAVAMLSAPSAHADQTLMLRDGQSVSADISLSAPTRMYFEGDAASQLIFNAVTGEPPEIAATVGETGDVFLTVVTGQAGQGVTGFLTTQGGRTYKMAFRITDVEAEQIEVVSIEAREELARAQATEAASRTAEPKPVKWKRTAGHHQAVASLLRTVHYRAVPQGMRLARSGETETPMVDGVRVERIHAVIAADVEAQKLRLTNTTDAALSAGSLRAALSPYIGIGLVDASLLPGAAIEIVLLRERSS